MGERCVRNAEVRGSIPLTSTTLSNYGARIYKTTPCAVF